MQALQVTLHDSAKRFSEPRVGGDGIDARRAGRIVGQRLYQQVGQVEHLDAVAAQFMGEGVMLVLGPADPRDAVEEELVVVARREPLQFRAGSVQQHRPQPGDFGVCAERARHPAEPMGSTRRSGPAANRSVRTP